MMMIAMVLAFAGCGEDGYYYDPYYGYDYGGSYYRNADNARYDALIGTWKGQLSTYYQAYNWSEGDYVTYITFNEYGRGLEVDYDYYTNCYYESSFSWTVANKVIYIQYDDLRYFRDVYICDYSIGSYYFDGYMYYDDPSKESQFRFDRISGMPEFYGARKMDVVEEESDSIAKKY